jgi:Tfp pilus assembly protein PilO
MIETVIRYSLKIASHRWIVITLSLAVALLVVWPAADEYFALKQQRGTLLALMEETRRAVAPLERLEVEAAQRQAELDKLERRLVKEDQVHDFRQQVVALVRESRCVMRRIRVGAPVVQPWSDDGSEPPSVAATSGKTRWVVKTRPLSLSVAGSLEEVKLLLARLHQTGRWLHTRNLSLRGEGTSAGQIVLELELLMYDCVAASPEAA